MGTGGGNVYGSAEASQTLVYVSFNLTTTGTLTTKRTNLLLPARPAKLSGGDPNPHISFEPYSGSIVWENIATATGDKVPLTAGDLWVAWDAATSKTASLYYFDGVSQTKLDSSGVVGGVGGGGNIGRVAKFTSTTTTIGDSIIYDDGTYVGIGVAAGTYKLNVAGTINAQGDISFDATSGRAIKWGLNTDTGFVKFVSTGDGAGLSYLEIGTTDNSDEPIKFTQTGNVRVLIDTDGYLKNGSSQKYVYENAGTWGISITGAAGNADTVDSIHGTSFLRNDANSTRAASYVTQFDNVAGTTFTAQASNLNLTVYQATAGNDAFITFHVAGDWAGYFGIGGSENDFVVGGWSFGSNRYKVWHAGNDGASSGLDADLWDGAQFSSYLNQAVLSSSSPTFQTLYIGASTKGYLTPQGTYDMTLHRVYSISFDWDGNYDTPTLHGIMSTNEAGSGADSISINSYDDINLRLDSNNNDASSYVRIHNNTDGNGQLAYLGYDGGSNVFYLNGAITGSNLRAEGVNPQLRFKNTNQTPPAGCYRIYIENDVWRIQRAATGDFTTATNLLSINSSGQINDAYWYGNTIRADAGGTGTSGATQNEIPYWSTTSTFGWIGCNTDSGTTKYLTQTNTGGAPGTPAWTLPTFAQKGVAETITANRWDFDYHPTMGTNARVALSHRVETTNPVSETDSDGTLWLKW